MVYKPKFLGRPAPRIHRARWLSGILLSSLTFAGVTQELPTPGTVQEQFRQQAPVQKSGEPSGIETAREAPKPGIPTGGKQILIDRFEISGNTVIGDAELDAIAAPFEGRSLTLFEIYEVADLLTRHYRDQGYAVASVTVPAQKVSSGIVLLEVIEGAYR